MTLLVLRLYDMMKARPVLRWISLVFPTLILALLFAKLTWGEDISAFLPLSEQHHEALQVYQDVSGANRLLAIFEPKEDDANATDNLCKAIDDFGALLTKADSAAIIKEITAQVDYDKMAQTVDFIYDNIPLFLTEADYERMDSLLRLPGFTERQLQEDLSILMFPTSGVLSENLGKDPLQLFGPVVSKLNKKEGAALFELHDGYIFTKDLKRGIVLLTSPYGNSETRCNARLLEMLNAVADSVETRNESVSVHYTGGPVIAVGNSNRIKQDSILSVALAVVLIVALLYYAFRNLRNMLLIVLSVSWGGLFALGILSVFRENVSLIVIGISSIIVGIAVNYPLHLIAHATHIRDIRQALSEIVKPLVIGNITTVGAFCALIPLQAAALRDLGFFSALLLIGTILFVVLWLPHMIIMDKANVNHHTKMLDRLSNLPFEKNKWVVWLICILTPVFGWFSLKTGFDADISHINYMTDNQRADMEYMQKLTSGKRADEQSIYIVSKGKSVDKALDHSLQVHNALCCISARYTGSTVSGLQPFLCSQEEQARRIDRWQDFVTRHADVLGSRLTEKTVEAGFSRDAFAPFRQITEKHYQPQEYAYFTPLKDIFSSYINVDRQAGTYRVIDIVRAKKTDVASLEKEIDSILPEGSFCFDTDNMNSMLARTLTDNFNYVGWVCAAIVFLFLWFSFGNIRLAILSFLPMAISWIWILGIMGLLGIQFNIVNVILATFIFGQGDDYTIFMTEGCIQEHIYGKPVLASHKRSIALSAMIMFIGIGSLIFASHPALRSLADVTIVGMFSVVLMAYVIPPFFLKVENEE